MKKLALLSLFLVNSAFAAQPVKYALADAPEMIGNQIEQEVTIASEAFREEEKTSLRGNESWVLSRIRFLIKPFVAFDAKLLSIEVVPTLEFRWERGAPIGWDKDLHRGSETKPN